MSIRNAIYEVHRLDDLASRKQWVNELHPLVKLVVTIAYIITVVSFYKYDLLGLIGMGLYLFVVFTMADLSFGECLHRVRFVLPVVCLVGLVNPFIDRIPVQIGMLHLNTGCISMATLILKGVFTISASYLLVATTSIDDICAALRHIHVPKIMVTQIMLTYRYISVLLEEVEKITSAYSLRAPSQKGVHFKVWGSLTGQLLLRSFDKAEAVYESMVMRGFNGEFAMKQKQEMKVRDYVWLMWIIAFVILRYIPIVVVIGNVVGGMFG